MNFKHTIINNNHVIIVDSPEYFTVAIGRVFKEVLTNRFPEADGEFIIGYKDADENYTFSGQNPIDINTTILNNIPEEEWDNEVWGD